MIKRGEKKTPSSRKRIRPILERRAENESEKGPDSRVREVKPMAMPRWGDLEVENVQRGE